MNSDRWRTIRDLLENTVDLGPTEREAYLSRCCGGDVALRTEVEALLAGSDNAPTFFDTPAVAAYADVLGLEQASSLVGQRIGAYRLERFIASGGMGMVYLAVRPDSPGDKHVAIKLIKRQMLTADTLRRFRIERQALAALNHNNIAAQYDGGVTDVGLPYLVMEFVDGMPIDQYCDQQRHSTQRRLRLFQAVCSAVAYAHRNLIVHRDLKPNNILVTREGIPKLLDFGIAKVLHPHTDGRSGETTTKHRILTPEYASPEHIRGETITTASDVYSLGVILYGLLTGHRPYRFKSRVPHEIEQTICEQDPEKPSTVILRNERVLLPDESSHVMLTPETVSRVRAVAPEGLRRQLTGDLDAIVTMSLRKEPQRRYSSVEQFSEDIHCHLEGRPVTARKDSTGYRLTKFVRRNRVAVIAAVLLSLSLVTGFILTLWQSRIAIQAQLIAQDEAIKTAQVNDFLQGMLASVDPLAAQGGDTTVRQILDEATSKLDSGALENQPEAEADVRMTMGMIYFELGAYQQAEQHLDAALQIRQEILGAEHPDVAECLNGQGLLARARGDYGEAERLYREALRLRRAALGDTHLSVAATMNNLGVLRKIKGELSQAETLLREALAIRRTALGPQHEDVATTMSNLAAVLKHKREYQEAESLYRDALEVFRAVLDPNHLRVAGCMNNLALLLRDRQDYDEAELLLRQALTIRQQAFQEEHPAVATGLHNLALILRLRGDNQEAQSLYREALTLRRKLLGPNHPRVANTANNLAELLASTGDFTQAEPLAREALLIRRAKLPPDHPRMAGSLLVLGNILVGLDDPGDAEPLLRESLAVFVKKLPPGHQRIVHAQMALGSCAVALEDFAQAEEVLLAAYATLGENEPSPSLMTDLLQRIVELYQAWGKNEQANHYMEKLHDLAERE